MLLDEQLKLNANQPPRIPIARRLDYIKARLQGETPQKMIENAFDERGDHLNHQIQEVAIALLERQDQMEQGIKNLIDEAEALQMFKPAVKQMKNLDRTNGDLKNLQNEQITALQTFKHSLDRKTKARDSLGSKLSLFNELLKEAQENEHKLEAYFCQAGTNLSNHIYTHLKNSPKVPEVGRK